MAFPESHIHQPQTEHTHTAILLHGRGSNGPEFAEELFSSATSDGRNLPSRLPSWRWVFPTSCERQDTRFQDVMPAWFDVYSLEDIHERQELQVDGLRESVLHVLDVIESEIKLLDGKAGKVFLGGISQGMATALWTMLCSPARIRGNGLGGFLAFCGWLPFARQIEAIIQQPHVAAKSIDRDEGPTPPAASKGVLVSRFLLDTIGQPQSEAKGGNFESVLSMPVFLSHGTDDIWVDVALGRQAHQILTQMGMQVEWREYLGAEGEGHWIKEPEGFDDIVLFLESHSVGEK